MRVIDVHTHIFPDALARKATVATAEYFDLPEPPNHYGTVGELVEVLEEAGITLHKPYYRYTPSTRTTRTTGRSCDGSGSTGFTG